jgi:hypothetical protein
VVCLSQSDIGYFSQLIDFSGCIALLQAYFDESEREGGTFCVAGYAFAPQQVKKFGKEWSRLFAPYPGGLHMRDLAQRTRSFKGIDAEEQKRLICEAVKIINRRMTGGFAVSCNIHEIRELSPRWIRGFGHAYSICCHLAMTAVGRYLDKIKSADSVTYVFESGHKNESEARDFIHNAVRCPEALASYRHSGDAFLPKADAVPLQAADMLAWEWAKFRDETLERRIRPPRRSLQALMDNRLDRYEGTHVTGEPLRKFMAEVRALGLLQLEEERIGKP